MTSWVLLDRNELGAGVRPARLWPEPRSRVLQLPADVALVMSCAAAGALLDTVVKQRGVAGFGPQLVASTLELLPVLVLARLARHRLEMGRPLRLPALALATLMVAALGGAVGFAASEHDVSAALYAWLGMSLPCALLVAAFEIHARAVRGAARAAEVERTNTQLEAELHEARARMLEAQIEPHFLFNTLANVRQLHRVDPGAGRKMLRDLIEYLETALPGQRSDSTTLHEEQALLAAYLRLHGPRFGQRLRFDISFPEPLLGCQLPSMMLLTLVENSVKHGLAPLADGGTIQLSAETSGTTLVVTVADTGAGMGAGCGGGTGLANIRSRLALRYGEAAGLTLSLNQPKGVRAALRIPLSREPAA